MRSAKFVEQKLASLAVSCRIQRFPLTMQRRAIMELLAGRADHPTADQLYDSIKERFPGISRTTVYRVLETFVSLGLIQKISNPEAKARFDAETVRHHHIQCSRCGVVSDLHDDKLDSLELPGPEKTGFHITDYSIHFTGICTSCSTAHRH